MEKFVIRDEDMKCWIVNAKDKRDAVHIAVQNGYPKPYFGSYYSGHEDEFMQIYEVVQVA